MSERVKLRAERLSAGVEASSVDAQRRTVDVRFYSGAAVDRYNWADGRYKVTFSLDPGHVRLGRLNGGAPVLNNHSDWSLDDVLGVVERASVSSEGGMATLRFDTGELPEAVFGKIERGILRNVSMGVVTHKVRDVTPEDSKMKHYLAVDWEPAEISVVPVPADPGAQFMSAENGGGEYFECELERADAQTSEVDMVRENNAGTDGAREEMSADQIRAAAVEGERARVAEINRLAAPFRLEAAFVAGLIGEGRSVEEARVAIMDELARRSETNPTRSSAAVTRDQADSRRSLVQSALLHRFEPANYKLEGEARRYRGMSLLRLAEECLSEAGAKLRGLGPMEIAGGALGLRVEGLAGYMGTSDFPLILANTANKVLRDAYALAPATFKPFCRRVTASDFKSVSVPQLGDAPNLEKVGPSGEFHYGSISEAGESYQLATYGKIVPLNRQSIINDDMGAFTRIPMLQGRACARLESDTVWAVVTGTSTMADGDALFHTNHKNLAAGAEKGAPSVATLAVGRKAFRLQKGLDSVERLNLRPKFLMLPAAHETTVDQLFGNVVPEAASNAIPEYIRQLQRIVEPRLDDNSVTAWYLACDPADIDTIYYAYLSGEEGPVYDSEVAFDVDGIKLKVRLDFGAKAIDHRGLYKNPGA